MFKNVEDFPKNCSCRQCNTEMHKSTKGGQGLLGVIGVLIMGVIVIALFFFFWPAAIVVLIISACLPSNKKKVIMLCGSCGYHFERM